MTAIEIPENILDRAGISQQEARLELACRLFEIGRLDLYPAAQLAGISRDEMETALLQRKIPVYQYTVEDLHEDLKTLDRMGI